MARYQRKVDLLIAMQIREDAQKYHEEYIEKVKHEHGHHLEKLEGPPILEVKQNEGDEPMTLSNGVIIMPGHFYAESADFTREPFGISDEELANEYVEVEDEPTTPG